MNGLTKIEMRKLVPVASKISAGKSKLLNVLYNINFLESTAGIGTKFINILRYNPNINYPCFYHLIVKKEGEKYNFYKDDNSQKYEGEDSIIKANKDINELNYNKKKINYEDLFYMTEINSTPFISDQDYLLTHDLCDIPGLSEYQNNEEFEKKNNDEDKMIVSKIEQIKEEDKEIALVSDLKKDYKSLLDNNLKEAKIEIEQQKKENDIEDDIFNNIKDENEDKTYITEIFKIIKNYIDGGIIILSIDNYQSKDNYFLIAKLHKVIQKPITNFLILLNKMDLSEDPIKDINDCKGLFAKYFPKFKTFNLNLNTFIPISVNQLKNELLMKTHFKYLIYYHFYNYISKTIKNKHEDEQFLGNSFIDHLKEIMEINKKNKLNEIESKVNELNNFSNIDEINEEIISIINDIKNEFKNNAPNLGISKENFNNSYIIDNEDFDIDEDNNANNFNNVNPAYILKYFYKIHREKDKALIPNLSEVTKNLLNYFKNNKKIKIKHKEEIEEYNNDIILLKQKIMEFFNDINDKFKNNMKFNFPEINNLMQDISYTIESLKNYNSIFIPFLGEINSGKSTILNGIIGEDILPTGLKQCTKRGIIIKYTNKETIIGKAYLKKEIIKNQVKYYFDYDNEIIGIGLEQVKDTLKGLDYEFNKKEEDSFYYIKTKIKLFDELGLDNNLKV